MLDELKWILNNLWTHVILKIHFNSEVEQKLYNVGVASRTSPVQSGSAVLKRQRQDDAENSIFSLINTFF